MPADYAVLAPIYDTIGMSKATSALTPKLMDYAQRLDWLGRRIVVLGCGTGSAIEYLSQYPYTITGVDSAPEMLEIARRKLNVPGTNVRWLHVDMRDTGSQIVQADMVLALNVINELSSLRDLETVFASVQRILESGKLFIFDLLTLQGLSSIQSAGSQIAYDAPDNLSVFTDTDYDYERQMQTIRYIIFRYLNGSWQRSEAQRILRGFPVQAAASLLQRNGFHIRALLNSKLETYDPAASRADKVIFIAEKQSA